MAIADIQIAPPVLSLDPATRQGRFRVQVANQLGRDGRLQVSLVPVGEAKPEWLRLDERFAQLVLKKDETVVFDVAVAVPSDVAPGTYGFKLRCADELDPANVKVDSEQRDFVLPPAVKPPPPPVWRKWVLIAVAVLIGGGITLAILLSGGGKKCEPACLAGKVCEDGKCIERGSPGTPDAKPRADAACVEGTGTAPCGNCGVLLCDGNCSKPTPPNFGQVKELLHDRVSLQAAALEFGRACDPGFVFEGATVTAIGGPCHLLNPGSGKDCRIRVFFGAIMGPTLCEIVIRERRVCD